MILDASAIIAILRDVPERAEFNRAIENASRRRVSAVNYVGAAVVMDASWNPIASRKLAIFFREGGLVIEPVTEQQARIAREAYRDFGKDAGTRRG